MSNPLEWLSAHLVYYETLNLIFSTSKQNILNLVDYFGAIHVGIMHAKYQPSSFNGVEGGRGGDRPNDGQFLQTFFSFLQIFFQERMSWIVKDDFFMVVNSGVDGVGIGLDLLGFEPRLPCKQ